MTLSIPPNSDDAAFITFVMVDELVDLLVGKGAISSADAGYFYGDVSERLRQGEGPAREHRNSPLIGYSAIHNSNKRKFENSKIVYSAISCLGSRKVILGFPWYKNISPVTQIDLRSIESSGEPNFCRSTSKIITVKTSLGYG